MAVSPELCQIGLKKRVLGEILAQPDAHEAAESDNDIPVCRKLQVEVYCVEIDRAYGIWRALLLKQSRAVKKDIKLDEAADNAARAIPGIGFCDIAKLQVVDALDGAMAQTGEKRI